MVNNFDVTLDHIYLANSVDVEPAPCAVLLQVIPDLPRVAEPQRSIDASGEIMNVIQYELYNRQG